MRSAGSRADTARYRDASGPVTIRALAWFIASVRSLLALRLATMRARAASTAPSRPFGGPRPAGLSSPVGLTESKGPDLPGRQRSCRIGAPENRHGRANGSC
jgi:hypothetical protein